jgi:hypothetical protein
MAGVSIAPSGEVASTFVQFKRTPACAVIHPGLKGVEQQESIEVYVNTIRAMNERYDNVHSIQLGK